MIKKNRGDYMDKKMSGLKIGMVCVFSLIIAMSAIDASAWGGHRGGGYPYHHGFYHGYYHGSYGWGFHSRPYWYDYDLVVPPIGGFVAYLPDGYTTVIVGGNPYYYCGGYYFRPYSSGYVIVPAPAASNSAATTATSQAQGSGSGEQQQASSGTAAQVSPSSEANKEAKSLNNAGEEPKTIAAQPKSAANDTATINIPNSKGGFTAVRLVKHKDGYIGPQGEFYAGHPTVDQLKALYGN
jgi:hypothetical protein